MSNPSRAQPSFVVDATLLKNVLFAANMSTPSIGLARVKTNKTDVPATQVPTTAETLGPYPWRSPSTRTGSAPSFTSSWDDTSIGTYEASTCQPNTDTQITWDATSIPTYSASQWEGTDDPPLASQATSTTTVATTTISSFQLAQAQAVTLPNVGLAADEEPTSSIFVGPGGVSATASDGSLFASSTASYTSISVGKVVRATGTQVY